MSTLAGRRADWRLDRRPQLPQVRMPTVGTWVILATFAVSWFAYTDARGDGNATIALFAGASSILAMSWSMVLAVRWRAVERLFGGQDRAYVAHRWLGAVAVVGVWLHTQTVDDIEGVAGASRSVTQAAEDLAENAQTVLYILAAASVIRWLPTRWRRHTHKLMIAPLTIAGWHQFTSTKPFANDTLWGRWSTAVVLVGIAAWATRVIIRDGFARGIRYRVTKVERRDSSITIELAPSGRRHLTHRPGQFAFLRADSLGLGEPHPFTIASHPNEPAMRFAIADLGDWTRRFRNTVDIGTEVRVEGPYGGLDLSLGGPSLWVAGGIGITPFLAGIPGLQPGSSTTLIHCFRDSDDTVGRDITGAAADSGRFTLHEFESSAGRRLDLDHLDELVGKNLTEHRVVICGPNSLVRAARRQTAQLGATDIHVDRFDIRGAIGPDLTDEVDELIAAGRQRIRRSTQPDEPADQSMRSTSP